MLLVLSLAVCAPAMRAQAGPTQPGPGVGEQSSPVSHTASPEAQEEDANDVYRHSAAVQKIAGWLHLNPEAAATLFEGLNFLVLVIGVGYFAAKTLPKQFKTRSSTIQKQLVDARTATEEARARLKAVEDRLGRLDGEIAGMRQQVEAEILREEQRLRESVEAETAKILAAAETEIQAATAAARRDLQRHAAELAVEHAAKRLVVSAETDRLLVQGLAQRLMGEKGGQN
jgi:F-type H+-transporting ATPase subunit b